MKSSNSLFLLSRLRITTILLILGIGMAACEEWFEDDDDDLGHDKKGVVAHHLDTPWEMVFAPDGRMFVTQRPGVVSVIKNGTVAAWLKLDSVVEEVGESGLLGLALDPDFNENGYVYIGYTYAASKGPLKLVNKLVRYRENPETKKPEFNKVLLDGIEGNYIHNSGPIEFGTDGLLYWAVGERYIPDLAQDKNVLNGKILRMTRDGEIPADNPFPGSYIYSLGHRNPQGLAFHPETNELWSTEHGPSEDQGCCMDEINNIKAGANYGWPVIRGSEEAPGMESPVYHSGDTTTWAPAGGYFVKEGDWQGSLIFTGLRGQALYRAVFDDSDPTKIAKVERYLYRKYGRLRNAIQGPDGKIYIAVSNQDGRGDPLTIDDRIIAFTVDEIVKKK
ncbi:MAG TPA: PQQ-dependent sugar dehydrogenase [Ohtaekwangia sp.]|nr:PQQ-dependent sugar dehydrogenase [Ohtaekwangia sp.]